MDIIILVLVIMFLVVLSGFFSGSETALTALSRAKIHALESRGDTKARMVSQLRRDKDKLIGTILLGNNIVNIFASALATSLAISLFGNQGVAYATIIMTILILVFAEVFPKTYAFYYSEKLALFTAPFISFMVMLFSPFVYAVKCIVDMLMKVLRVDKEGDKLSSTAELKGAIDLYHREGSMMKRDKDMLQSILDLTEVEVVDIMVHRKNIVSVNIDAPVDDIVAKVRSSCHTRLPVWEEKSDNIIGIIHAKDLLSWSYQGQVLTHSVIRQMLIDPWFIPENSTLNNQLMQFRKRHYHMALVVDEYGDLVGLVTLEDILEEIVGHIYDEHDIASPKIRKLKDDSVIIDGDMTIRDLNRQFDWHIEDEEATTIAGFVIHYAEHIPEEGQEFEFDGFSFKVIKKDHNQITSLKVKKIV